MRARSDGSRLWKKGLWITALAPLAVLPGGLDAVASSV
jgi:hypothetical protein